MNTFTTVLQCVRDKGFEKMPATCHSLTYTSHTAIYKHRQTHTFLHFSWRSNHIERRLRLCHRRRYGAVVWGWWSPFAIVGVEDENDDVDRSHSFLRWVRVCMRYMKCIRFYKLIMGLVLSLSLSLLCCKYWYSRKDFRSSCRVLLNKFVSACVCVCAGRIVEYHHHHHHIVGCVNFIWTVNERRQTTHRHKTYVLSVIHSNNDDGDGDGVLSVCASCVCVRMPDNVVNAIPIRITIKDERPFQRRLNRLFAYIMQSPFLRITFFPNNLHFRSLSRRRHFICLCMCLSFYINTLDPADKDIQFLRTVTTTRDVRMWLFSSSEYGLWLPCLLMMFLSVSSLDLPCDVMRALPSFFLQQHMNVLMLLLSEWHIFPLSVRVRLVSMYW